MLVEGRHFLPGAEPRAPRPQGARGESLRPGGDGRARRAGRRSRSRCPRRTRHGSQPFAAGFLALAERYGVDLIGGDTTRGERCTICVTAIGEVPPGMALERGAARAGDDVWVSGELGGAALGARRIPHDRRTLAQRLHAPSRASSSASACGGLAHAAIDLSDGLAGDLGHILRALAALGARRIRTHSAPQGLRGAARIRELEKNCVLSGGDDYELLFTAPQAHRAEIDALAAELKLALTRIGSLGARRARGSRWSTRDGQPLAHRGGFDHFGGR